MKNFPNGINYMQLLHWKNRDQFVVKNVGKKSNCQCKCWLTFYLQKVVEFFSIKSKNHKLAVINKLLVVNFFDNLLRKFVWKQLIPNLVSCSHAFVPEKMLELEIDRKCLNYNENLKFMPFGKSFHLYAIWELCHLGSYHLKAFLYVYFDAYKVTFDEKKPLKKISIKKLHPLSTNPPPPPPPPHAKLPWPKNETFWAYQRNIWIN